MPGFSWLFYVLYPLLSAPFRLVYPKLTLQKNNKGKIRTVLKPSFLLKLFDYNKKR